MSINDEQVKTVTISQWAIMCAAEKDLLENWGFDIYRTDYYTELSIVPFHDPERDVGKNYEGARLTIHLKPKLSVVK